MDIISGQNIVKDIWVKKKNNAKMDVLQIFVSSLGYQPLHAKKLFRDKIFLATGSVRKNVYPLCPPTWFCVTAYFRGVLGAKDPCVEKMNRKDNFIKLSIYTVYTDKCPSQKICWF